MTNNHCFIDYDQRPVHVINSMANTLQHRLCLANALHHRLCLADNLVQRTSWINECGFRVRREMSKGGLSLLFITFDFYRERISLAYLTSVPWHRTICFKQLASAYRRQRRYAARKPLEWFSGCRQKIPKRFQCLSNVFNVSTLFEIRTAWIYVRSTSKTLEDFSSSKWEYSWSTVGVLL